MAISLPDTRQLSDEVLQSLRLRALRGCELGYSEIEVAELLGLSRETVSRWWTAYVDHGLEALPGDRTGRPVAPVVPQRRASGTAADDPQRKKPRGGGDRLPDVDPQGRRRVDPQGVRDRHAGADRREYLERWGYTAKVPRVSQGSGPRGGPPLAGGHLPAIERRAAREMRRSTGATRPARRLTSNRDGYAREGRPARIEVPDPHIRIT